jgi:hypothetical protein
MAVPGGCVFRRWDEATSERARSRRVDQGRRRPGAEAGSLWSGPMNQANQTFGHCLCWREGEGETDGTGDVNSGSRVATQLRPQNRWSDKTKDQRPTDVRPSTSSPSPPRRPPPCPRRSSSLHPPPVRPCSSVWSSSGWVCGKRRRMRSTLDDNSPPPSRQSQPRHQ